MEERRESYREFEDKINHFQKDLDRLEKTIDRLNEAVNTLDKSTLLLSPRVDLLEKNERPCKEFLQHLTDHSKRQDLSWSFALRVASIVTGWLLTAVLGATLAVWIKN